MRLFRHYIAIFILILVPCYNSFSQQINILSFNKDTAYAPGSGVSVILNPTGVFELNNDFILELSDLGGTWNSPITLTTLHEFYTPTLNGVLPNTITPGNYKLRVRSTLPEIIIETPIFQVVNSTLIAAPKLVANLTTNQNFFNCINCNDEQLFFGSLNRGDDATVINSINPLVNRTLNICDYDTNFNYSVNLTKIINVPTPLTASETITISNGSFEIPQNLGVGTYVLEVTKSDAVSSSVRSSVFLFHGNATNLGNATSEQVCLSESVSFVIDKTISGIGRNYYGSKYQIDFGDGNIVSYTHAQLLSMSVIDHTYTSVSCNEPNGFYEITKTLYNKGVLNNCSNFKQNGNGVSKNVSISGSPNGNFSLSASSCINTLIFAKNTTIPGSYGADGCNGEVNYYWYYKKPTDTNFTFVPTSSPWINNKK